MNAFRTTRKRRKEKKSLKDRLVAIQPAAAELQPLAANLACSMLHTEGMDDLERRTEHAGSPPSFWIAAADLDDRDGKRVPKRISFQSSADVAPRSSAVTRPPIAAPNASVLTQ